LATITKQIGKTGTRYKARIKKPNNPTVTKTFSSKNLAEKWARKSELEIEEGTYFEKQEAAKHTVSSLIDRYVGEIIRGHQAPVPSAMGLPADSGYTNPTRARVHWPLVRNGYTAGTRTNQGSNQIWRYLSRRQ
jgi:hypothetical protein